MSSRSRSVGLVECKASRTVTPSDAAPMRKLTEALCRVRRGRVSVRMDLVHQAPKAGAPTTAVAPGVRASAWQDFVRAL